MYKFHILNPIPRCRRWRARSSFQFHAFQESLYNRDFATIEISRLQIVERGEGRVKRITLRSIIVLRGHMWVQWDLFIASIRLQFKYTITRCSPQREPHAAESRDAHINYIVIYTRHILKSVPVVQGESRRHKQVLSTSVRQFLTSTV